MHRRGRNFLFRRCQYLSLFVLNGRLQALLLFRGILLRMGAHCGDLPIQLCQPLLHAAQSATRLFGSRSSIHQMLLNGRIPVAKRLRQLLRQHPSDQHRQKHKVCDCERHRRLLGVQSQLGAPLHHVRGLAIRVVLVCLLLVLLRRLRLRRACTRRRLRLNWRLPHMESHPEHHHQRKPSKQAPFQRSLHCDASGSVPAGITARIICSLNSALIPSIWRRAVATLRSISAFPAFTFSAVAARASASAWSRWTLHSFSLFSRAANISALALPSVSSYSAVFASAAEIESRACSTAPVVLASR